MMDASNDKGATERVVPTNSRELATSSSSSPVTHSAPELIGVQDASHGGADATIDEIDESKQGWFAYFTTRNFWIVLVLGYEALVTDIGCIPG